MSNNYAAPPIDESRPPQYSQYAVPPRDEPGAVPRAAYNYEQVASTLEPRIEDNLKSFSDLTKQIHQLEVDTAKLPGAQAQLAPLAAQQKQLQDSLNSAVATIAKANEILTGFHPFKSKDEWKAKLAQAQAQKADLETKLPPVTAQVQQAQSVVNSLQNEARDLEAARRQYARLLSLMFDGATPGYPEEQQLEDQASAAYARWVEVATDLPALQNAEGHLKRAGQLLAEGLQRLQGAIGANTGAMIMAAGRGGGRGTIMEVMQQAQIRAAGELCQNANSEILVAMQIMPSIPNLANIQISQHQGMFLFQLMAGNAFMDLIARQRIRESFEYLAGQMQILNGVIAWVTNAIASKRGTVDTLRQQLDQSRAKLLGKRVAIAEGLIQVKFNEALPHVQMMLQPPVLPVSQQVKNSPAPATVINQGNVMSIQPGYSPYGVQQNVVYSQQPTMGSRYDLW